MYCIHIKKGSTAQNSIARKNWSTQVKQLTKKVKTGRKSKIICRTCISSSFTFRQKKYQLLELQLVDKGFGKCQLLDTIYSKENGVHVRQLG